MQAVLLSLVTSRGSAVLQNIPGLVLKVELMAVDILFSMTGTLAMVMMQFTVYSTRVMVSALIHLESGLDLAAEPRLACDVLGIVTQ